MDDGVTLKPILDVQYTLHDIYYIYDINMYIDRYIPHSIHIYRNEIGWQ